MSKRRLPFPLFQVAMSLWLISLSGWWVFTGRGDFMAGWAAGSGCTFLVVVLMFWASPMNEASE